MLPCSQSPMTEMNPIAPGKCFAYRFIQATVTLTVAAMLLIVTLAASPVRAAAPSAPTGLSAAWLLNTVTLNWTASPNATSYNVYRSTTQGFGYGFVESVSLPTASDTVAVTGGGYFYVVTAVNIGGESPFSNEAAVQPIGPPTAVNAFVGNGQVTLTWSAPPVSAPPAPTTNYTIYRSTSSSSGFVPIANAVTAQFYSDTPSTVGVTYYYKVGSSNASGIGSTSAAVAAEPIVPAILHNFGGGPTPVQPSGGLVLGPDGSYYGVSTRGGQFDKGAMYKVSTAGQVTFLYSFTGGSDGSAPVGPLVLDAGLFYGETTQGGNNGLGAVFSATPQGLIAALHSFNGADGATPIGGLVLAQTGMYGVTSAGGANLAGTLFSLGTDGSVADLHDFDPVTEGTPSGGLLLDTQGILYGFTGNGGTSGLGVLYSRTIGGTVSILHNFTGVEGSSPSGTPILVSDAIGDQFYAGVASGGGAFAFGSVFAVSTLGTNATNATNTLYSFTGSADGANPVGGLVFANGQLYGTTQAGGTNGNGVVFSKLVDTQATDFSVIHEFTGTPDGAAPNAALVADSSGNLYGVTTAGGANSVGLVFRIGTTGSFLPLASLQGSTDGIHPSATLIQGANGLFYGVSSAGGLSDLGAVYSMDTTGAINILHSFAGGADGSAPSTPLVQASNGTLYGITSSGGPSNNGVIYSITPTGVYTILHSNVASDGSNFQGVAIGSDGNIYGTAAFGGLNGLGTLFEFTGTTHPLTIIANFDGGNNGGVPTGPLLLAANGKLYGTTNSGGVNNAGVVFSVSHAVINMVAPIGTTTSMGPVGGLVQSPDGNLYGVTVSGGTGSSVIGGVNAGTVFSVTSSGIVSTVYSFTGLGDGGTPSTGLVVGPDHNLYGTTTTGGAFNNGTIFMLTPSGLLTPMFSFPSGTATGLVRGTDTNFYGVVSGGGTLGLGTAYRVSFPSASIPTPIVTVINPTTAFVGGPSFTLNVNGNSFQPGAIVNWTRNGVTSALATTFVSGNLLQATVSSSLISTVGTASVTVTNPAGVNPAGVTSAAVSFSINTPAPTITSVSPPSVGVGSPALTITVTGTNFTPGSVIHFNGANLPTNVVSLTVATAVIPAASLVSPGTAFVGINNIPPNFPSGGGSATVPFAINNPVPAIVGLSLSNAPVSTGPISVTITGSGFVPTSVVFFSGTPLTTSFVSAGQLNAVIPKSLLSAIGTVNITVHNPGPGGGVSSAVVFTVTPPIAHTFGPGLQLISAPEDYSGATLASAFDVPSPRLAVWDASLNIYDVTPEAPADSIRPGQGYWVRFATQADLFNTGVPTSTTASLPIPLKAGWNMIGDPFSQPVLISSLHVLDANGNQYTLQGANAAGIISLTAYSYDNSIGQYVQHTIGDSLFPYSGYWILTFSRCALVVTPPGG